MSSSARKFRSGFTLVELLVVISILAILAVVGAALYSGVSKSSRDSKRKADIQAIAKAYETNYQNGSYQTLTTANFAAGTIPQDPAGGSYYTNISSDNSAFRVCTALESNPQRTCSSPSTNCYCLTSTQGSYTSGSGGSLDHPSSCDPNGTLSYELVGYWRMDEGSGTSVGNSTSTTGINGTLYTPTASWLIGSGCKVGNCTYFDGTDNAWQTIRVPDNSVLDGMSTLTVGVWVKLSTSKLHQVVYKRQNYGTPVWYSYKIEVNTSNRPQFTVANTSGTVAVALSDSAITLNEWHHLVGVYDGTRVQIYIDKDAADSTPSTLSGSVLNSDTFLMIGGLDGPYLTNGYLDDVRVYNRSLLIQEIEALFGNTNGCVPL